MRRKSRRIQNPHISEYVPVDCSTLNECGGNWACVEYLMALYRLDCVAGPGNSCSLILYVSPRGSLTLKLLMNILIDAGEIHRVSYSAL